MSPGPSLAVVLRQTVNNGRGHGLAASWCHALGVGLWAIATIAGLAVVVAQSQTLFAIITWCGAGYLAWLRWGFDILPQSETGNIFYCIVFAVPDQGWQHG
jgi:threonine/homoserine/homoserine lactone efflux protein